MPRGTLRTAFPTVLSEMHQIRTRRGRRPDVPRYGLPISAPNSGAFVLSRRARRPGAPRYNFTNIGWRDVGIAPYGSVVRFRRNISGIERPCRRAVETPAPTVYLSVICCANATSPLKERQDGEHSRRTVGRCGMDTKKEHHLMKETQAP